MVVVELCSNFCCPWLLVVEVVCVVHCSLFIDDDAVAVDEMQDNELLFSVVVTAMVCIVLCIILLIKLAVGVERGLASMSD